MRQSQASGQCTGEANGVGQAPIQKASTAVASAISNFDAHDDVLPPLANAKQPPETIKSKSISSDIVEILNLSFPRCSICQTGWYNTDADDEAPSAKDGASAGNDIDNLLDRHASLTTNGKRKKNYSRSSHLHLFPLPTCSCTTRLALPHNLPAAIFSTDAQEEREDYYTQEDPLDVLSQLQSHAFPNLAICKACLAHRIEASNEITVHDYRQEHIPHGQRNVKFTVEPDCVQCKRKFRVRELERLLESGGGPKINNIEYGGGSSRKKKGKKDANWWEAVQATIHLVRWGKREIRRERKRLRRQKREQKMNASIESEQYSQSQSFWENHSGFTGGESSDECFSLSSDSDEDWQSEDESKPTKKGPHRVELTSGELFNELLQKDPRFRQEREDDEYVRKLMEEEKAQMPAVAQAPTACATDEQYAKKLLEEERERQKAADEEQARKDHELAMKMQGELNKAEKQSNGNGKEELMKTRSSRRNPILNAWGKASAKKPEQNSASSAKKPGQKQPPTSTGKSDQKRTTPKSGRKRANNTGQALSKPSPASAKNSPATDSIDMSRSPIIDITSSPDRKKQKLHSDSQTSASGNVARATSCLSNVASAASATNNTYSSDEDVNEIVSMGFTESSARRCLKDAGGNVQMAVSILLSEASEKM